MKKLKGAKTPLEKKVQSIVSQETKDSYSGNVEAYLNDLFRSGCQSGMVNCLIYYADTLKWYKKYIDEINQLLKDTMDSLGTYDIPDIFGEKWDKEDPLCLDTHNQNLLAWVSFEETARTLAERSGIEI